MLDNLDKYKIILASGSPRRKELLKQLGIKFEVKVLEGIEESYPKDLPLSQIAPFLSLLKAKAYSDLVIPDKLIITADTIVICDGKMLGKPTDLDDAKSMLRFMSGKSHTVISGVTVLSRDRTETISVNTSVTFGELSKEEISYYVENFRPLDKAGAYGIQEWIGGVAVKRIDGSFYNVMGLPIHQLYNLLKTF